VVHQRQKPLLATPKKAEAPPSAFQRPKATITLANGEHIVLDDSAGSTLVRRENIKIVRLADGQIAYEPTAVSSRDSTWHTLTVPEGCRPLQISLADGTKVWVNTASALRYPVAFNGNKRNVTLTGEAYFEVAQDKEKPFTVETQDVSVHVLGTAFDVSSYSDDRQHNVVLVSGRVELATDGHSGDAGHQLRPDEPSHQPIPGDLRRQLKPGDLATYTPGTGRLSITAVNTEEYISWRKGYLIFKRAPLEEIIKRLSRYYNIQIDMGSAAHTSETFSGRLDFQQNFEDIMEMLCTGTPFVYQAKERKLVLKDNVNNK
jgi:ferric-dicitrate binding protein FerR (iron transport regulator)